MDLKQTTQQVNDHIKALEAKIEVLKAELAKFKKIKKVVEN